MANNIKDLEGSLILVVEDNTSLLRDISFLLQIAGFNVMIAASGDAALSVMKRQTPDLVVCDVNMPGLSGLELLSLMRADKRWAYTPCILTSGSYEYDDLMSALDMGASEFLPKPFDAYELIDAICLVLEETFTLNKAAG